MSVDRDDMVFLLSAEMSPITLTLHSGPASVAGPLWIPRPGSIDAPGSIDIRVTVVMAW
jgi:hypothetical protein